MGLKRDREETDRRYANGTYIDERKRSYVALDGREKRFGVDMQIQHDAVMFRDDFRCVECGARSGLQVHHKRHRGQSGGDELGNLETLCVACHRAQHPQVQVNTASRRRERDD